MKGARRIPKFLTSVSDLICDKTWKSTYRAPSMHTVAPRQEAGVRARASLMRRSD